jgi:hypothetical protein
MTRARTSLILAGVLAAGLIPLLAAPASAEPAPTHTWQQVLDATTADTASAGGLSVVYDSHVVVGGSLDLNTVNHAVFRTDGSMRAFYNAATQKTGADTQTIVSMPGRAYLPAGAWFTDGWGGSSAVYLRQVKAKAASVLGFTPAWVYYGTGDTASSVLAGYTYGCDALFSSVDCSYDLAATSSTASDGSGLWSLSVSSGDPSLGTRKADVMLAADGALVSYATVAGGDQFSQGDSAYTMTQSATFSYAPQKITPAPLRSVSTDRVVNALDRVGIPAGGSDVVATVLSSVTSSVADGITFARASHSRTPVRAAYNEALVQVRAMLGSVWRGQLRYSRTSYLFTFTDPKTGASFTIPVSRASVLRGHPSVGVSTFHWGRFTMKVPAHLVF